MTISTMQKASVPAFENHPSSLPTIQSKITSTSHKTMQLIFYSPHPLNSVPISLPERELLHRIREPEPNTRSPILTTIPQLAKPQFGLQDGIRHGPGTKRYLARELVELCVPGRRHKSAEAGFHGDAVAPKGVDTDTDRYECGERCDGVGKRKPERIVVPDQDGGSGGARNGSVDERMLVLIAG